ncbi:MAG: N-methyl-D-aspartate receptor NMDAR2C subunit, partial [Gemmatimonadales bacterium]
MPAESGALDRKRWTELWARLGAEGSGVPSFIELNRAYAEPARAYHNAAHIRDCLAQLDLTRSLADRPDEVEAAIWFHDAVHLPGALDNEDRSARLAWDTLTGAAVSPETSHRITELVLATRHVALPDTLDAQLLCDIDLSILARTPDEFNQFERWIREEYAWVPDSVYRSSRSEIMAGFLRRRSIYQTEYFRSRYEVPAR